MCQEQCTLQQSVPSCSSPTRSTAYQQKAELVAVQDEASRASSRHELARDKCSYVGPGLAQAAKSRLLNNLVNLSLRGCTQLHRTDVVFRKNRTLGLRLSPRSPLALPYSPANVLPRRSSSYTSFSAATTATSSSAASSRGTSPHPSHALHASTEPHISSPGHPHPWGAHAHEHTHEHAHAFSRSYTHVGSHSYVHADADSPSRLPPRAGPASAASAPQPTHTRTPPGSPSLTATAAAVAAATAVSRAAGSAGVSAAMLGAAQKHARSSSSCDGVSGGSSSASAVLHSGAGTLSSEDGIANGGSASFCSAASVVDGISVNGGSHVHEPPLPPHPPVALYSSSSDTQVGRHTVQMPVVCGDASERSVCALSDPQLLENAHPAGLRSWSSPTKSLAKDAGMSQAMATERLAFGVSTAIGVRSTMEDFAFALPLAQPSSGDGCECLQAACFGVFDGHGGAGVAQSLAEHVPGRIQENVQHVVEFGPQHIAEVLTGHEKLLLRRLTEPWIVESSQALDDSSPCASHCPPNLISPCPAWESVHSPFGQQEQQKEQQWEQDGQQDGQQPWGDGGEERRGEAEEGSGAQSGAAAEGQQQTQQQQQQQQEGVFCSEQQQQEEQQQQQQAQAQDFEPEDPGSTALVVTILGDRLFCANVGDCRLLVAELDPSTNTVRPRRVTCDHNGQHPGEAARLAALSVSVSADGYVGGQEGWLQVSRSIGDFSVKRALGEEIILSEPELHTLRLTENTMFAVAVSDGITNKLSDETIINQVCRFLSEVPPSRKHAAAGAEAPNTDGPCLGPEEVVYPGMGGSPPLNNDPHYAASQLVQYAINAADSDDNCSVVVVSFKHSAPPAPRRPRLFQRKALTSSSLQL